jgi:hypothetical protein
MLKLSSPKPSTLIPAPALPPPSAEGAVAARPCAISLLGSSRSHFLHLEVLPVKALDSGSHVPDVVDICTQAGSREKQ